MSERAAPEPAVEQSSAVPVRVTRATAISFAVVVGLIRWFLTGRLLHRRVGHSSQKAISVPQQSFLR